MKTYTVLLSDDTNINVQANNLATARKHAAFNARRENLKVVSVRRNRPIA